MKLLSIVLALSLCSGCATLRKFDPRKKKPVAEKANVPVRKKSQKVRTSETVKAYPVGRYSDPGLPDVMHERHTVYRVEQSPDWNYLPDPPYALPLGPVVAESRPSSSYYVKAETEMMSGQQKAQVDALREQNRAMQKRIEALNKDQSKNQKLHAEIDFLKKELDSMALPASAPALIPAETSGPVNGPWSEFSDPQ